MTRGARLKEALQDLSNGLFWQLGTMYMRIGGARHRFNRAARRFRLALRALP